MKFHKKTFHGHFVAFCTSQCKIDIISEKVVNPSNTGAIQTNTSFVRNLIIRNYISGPSFLMENSSGEIYLEILRNTNHPLLLEIVDKIWKYLKIWKLFSKQDGAPQHFHELVRENQQYFEDG